MSEPSLYMVRACAQREYGKLDLSEPLSVALGHMLLLKSNLQANISSSKEKRMRGAEAEQDSEILKYYDTHTFNITSHVREQAHTIAVLQDEYRAHDIKFSALWLMILCLQVFFYVYIISVA